MLSEPRVVYVCDHVLDQLKKEPVSEVILRTLSTDDLRDKFNRFPYNRKINAGIIQPNIDLVPNATYISSVISVYELNDIAGKRYYEDVDFEIIEGTKVHWISANRPEDGYPYTIEYMNISREHKQYDLEDCPKCAGNGWYISLFGDKGSSAKIIKGINKMVQDFIKILFTIKDDNGYGSDIFALSSQPVYNESEFSSEVVRIVYECELQMKQAQLAYLNSGNDVSDDERLQSATVTSVEFDDIFQGFFVEILLKNESGNVAGLNLKV